MRQQTHRSNRSRNYETVLQWRMPSSPSCWEVCHSERLFCDPAPSVAVHREERVEETRYAVSTWAQRLIDYLTLITLISQELPV